MSADDMLAGYLADGTMGRLLACAYDQEGRPMVHAVTDDDE